MNTLQECAECEGAACIELMLCAMPSARHKSLLASYALNLKRGKKAVCDMIVGDIGRCVELGAQQRAADLSLVLREFLSDCRKAHYAARAGSGFSGQPHHLASDVPGSAVGRILLHR